MSRRVVPHPPPRFCGGIDWTDSDHYEWWRCPGIMLERVDWDETLHQCAASDDHGGDHSCAPGHHWPQWKPRRRWRDRLRRRGDAR